MSLTRLDPHITLRPWRDGDVPALVALANNRQVWRNMTDAFPHPYTEDDANDWIRAANQAGPSLHLAIEHDGALAGGIGAIAAIAGHGLTIATADVGYWLGEPHWGRGIATAAGHAFVEPLIATRRFARLQATVFEWNPRSMRVLEKLGFGREGVLRRSVSKDGCLIDSVMYALVAA